MDFVAIDFETANSQRDSACALGAVVIKNDKIVERRYSLINPHVEFHRYCTKVHGITKEAVASSPSFQDIYPVVFKMLDNCDLFAHNASFDAAVLKASCESRGLETPAFNQYCSVEMSRKAWPELTYHRLDALCEHFNITFKHHNAIEDATACALIVLIAAKEFNASTPKELFETLARKAKADGQKKAAAERELAAKLEKAKAELRASL